MEKILDLYADYLQVTFRTATEVKRRILPGPLVLSSGYNDAYYTKAQQGRRLIRQRTLNILGDYDFILMPVAPTMARHFGEKSDDPVAM